MGLVNNHNFVRTLKKHLLLILILLIAAFLRFYNLMYDSPYFFNPDERNMATAITRFRLPGNFNPHFFAYGQFPLYLAFFSDQITKLITYHPQLTTDFPSAIFWLRFWSALSSTFTVLLVYLISNKVVTPPTPSLKVRGGRGALSPGHYAAILATFTPGLIQSAHFGTTESLLTFFFMVSLYLSIKILRPPKYLIPNTKYIILLSLAIGLSLGSKLTGVFFFVLPLITLTIRTIKKKSLLDNLRIGLLVFIGSIGIFVISSPYNFIEPDNFLSAVFGYEADVATGKYEAFYTRQFVNTIPILFQAEKIFPYTLGWPVFILGTLGLLLSIKYYVLRIRYIKKRNKNILDTYYLILTTSFFVYLLPNSLLFAKWTRFMTPILPFFSIFTAFVVQQIYQHSLKLAVKIQNSKFKIQNYKSKVKNNKLLNFKLYFCILTFAFLISVILPGIAFMTIYLRDDTRMTASKWIYENITDKSYILSETANVVDIPLSIPNYQLPITNYQIISFDFYHLDENPKLFEELLTHLEKADYILIPSRRIFANYTRLPQKYPRTAKYYELLFSGKLGFVKVAEIRILDDENAEETFTVFDHPVIRIYRKVKQFNREEYTSLLRV